MYIYIYTHPCTLASTEPGIWMHILAWQGPTSNNHYFYNLEFRQNYTKGGSVHLSYGGCFSYVWRRIQNAGLRIFIDSTSTLHAWK